MSQFVGIDFGTSNSAVAIARSKSAQLVRYQGEPLLRTVLYFDRSGNAHAGADAIRRYLENESEGRLIQSIKSHLASKSFDKTQILGRTWSLIDLVSRFLRGLREGTDIELGDRAVVGRPVRYVGADSDDDDKRAISRMGEALKRAGFSSVEFVPEPIAAAASYATRIDRDQRVIIADFGGGTSDFSVLELSTTGTSRVLANAGVGVGGDSFDARVIDATIAPSFGKGSSYIDELGAETVVPSWIFGRLRRWHTLSFLKAPRTLALIERVARGATDPEAIERLRVVVEEDLGFRLHESVERAKVALSAADATTLAFESLAFSLQLEIGRDGLDRWIRPELERISETIAVVLDRAGVEPEAIDCVFATGGSSQVPAVQQLLSRAFPRAELASGEELTSVATGLALEAERLWSTG